LRTQIGPAVWQTPTGQLERRVAAQPVEIGGVLIAAGNSEDAGTQDVGQEMDDPVLIAPVRNDRSPIRERVISVFAKGKRVLEKRRSRDDEYLKRARGFESTSLQHGV
jgi:hypothetical protein